MKWPGSDVPSTHLSVIAPRAQAGLAQGELRGATQNLEQLCGIAGPLLWGRAYGWLFERGAAGRGLAALQCDRALPPVDWTVIKQSVGLFDMGAV